jgi:hypothetical protein
MILFSLNFDYFWHNIYIYIYIVYKYCTYTVLGVRAHKQKHLKLPIILFFRVLEGIFSTALIDSWRTVGTTRDDAARGFVVLDQIQNVADAAADYY